MVSVITKAQDLFVHYPVTASIAFNGGQQRLECSVYDSVLQTNVVYNTNWSSDIIIITGNHDGIVTYSFWTSPGVQAPKLGFLIYDYLLHEFKVKDIALTLGPNTKYNVIGGSMYAVVLSEYYYGLYDYHGTYYRYNLLHHKWVVLNTSLFLEEDTPHDIYAAGTSGDFEVLCYADMQSYNEFHYNFYDPISDSTSYIFSGCPMWFEIEDDNLSVDTGCMENYHFSVHDPKLHQRKVFPNNRLIGGLLGGLFVAWNDQTGFPGYCFTYDQEINDWVTDTIFLDNDSQPVMKDRIFAIASDPTVLPVQIYLFAYNPQLKIWDKDTITAAGAISGLAINNATVNWVDANGLNTRGYDISTGWGNYNTSVYLDFQLTEFMSEGMPVIHVRNYSIGRTDLFYDFGDGVRTNYKLATWHMYKNSGTYNVCLYTSDSLFSICKQITINNCSSAGAITASNDTICEGDTISLSIASHSGIIQWQRRDGLTWVNETGIGANDSVYTFVPMQTSIYRAIVTSAGCLSAFSNQLNIKVHPSLATAQLSDTLLNSCSGTYVRLNMVNPPVATFSWQQLSGSNWVIVPNTNNNASTWVNPTVSTDYRVIISSGSCFTKTIYFTVNVLQIPSIPVTSGDSICGPGIANLSASGSSNIEWHPTIATDSLLAIGNTYNPLVNTTSNYFVVATNGGTAYGGHPDNGFGTVLPLQTVNFGQRFYVDAPARLKSVAIYPQTSGVVNFVLRRAGSPANGPTRTINVVAGSGKTIVPLNFVLESGETYDLMITGQNVILDVNNSGITYPFTTLNNSLNILGYLSNNTFDTMPDYYGIYDWKFAIGCYSNAAQVQAFVGAPFVATATPAGPLTFCQGQSVTLNAQPIGIGYSYGWLNNISLIPGANGSSFNAVATGSYKAIIEKAGCKDTTSAMRVTVPCITPIEAGERTDVENTSQQSMNAFYNGQSNELVVNINSLTENNVRYSIIDYSGRNIISGNIHIKEGLNSFQIPANDLAQGIYMLRMYDGGISGFVKFLKH
ncbi:MAG: hypothetical protein IPN13_11475 [Bacteroidetes bacterium]|nr:hypothetical protein [Bacteroidota bacterium]